MTYEEYLAAPDIDEQTEWVRGEVVPMMSVTRKHSDLSAYLIGLLGFYNRRHSLGHLLHEPFNMKTGPDLPGRSPDLFFVRSENLSRVHENFLEGPADLVIEIVSPGTGTTDRRDKFHEYQSGGVREYWILDPHTQTAEFYVHDERGEFQAAEAPGGSFRSTVVDGFWLEIEWLWELPDPELVLAEIEGGQA